MSETVRMVSPFGIPPTPKDYRSVVSEADAEEAKAEVRRDLEEGFSEEMDEYLYEMARVGSGRLQTIKPETEELCREIRRVAVEDHRVLGTREWMGEVGTIKR